MGLEINSRTNKDIYYSFTDRSPEGLLRNSPHLADNFSFNLSDRVNLERLEEVVRDCAHPEIEALHHDGIEPVIRFIQAFGIKANPLYVYKINIKFYEQRDKVPV